MDEVLISNWNAVVGRSDEVWHLGDFGWRDTKRIKSVFLRLNGQKRLVIGNHDGKEVLNLPWSAPPCHYAEISVDRQRVVMCHYGMRVWNGMRRGAIQLYGHSHGRLPGTNLSLDVGIDCWGFTPVTIAQIRERMAANPPMSASRARWTMQKAPCPLGDPKMPDNAIRIGVMSDLHVEFEPDYWRRINRRAERVADALLLKRQLAAEPGHPASGPDLRGLKGQEPELVLLPGDIHVGVGAIEYADAVATYLEVPVYSSTGNHEAYGSNLLRLLDDLRAAAKRTGGRVQPAPRLTTTVG